MLDDARESTQVINAVSCQRGADAVVAELTSGSSAPSLVLDLGEVTEFDSPGLASLLEADRLLASAGRALVLINVPTGLRSLMRSAGLAHHFTIGRSAGQR